MVQLAAFTRGGDGVAVDACVLSALADVQPALHRSLRERIEHALVVPLARLLCERTTGNHATVLLTAQHICCIVLTVTSNQFKRWLAAHGCTFESGHGGHLIVRRGSRRAVLPMHGSGRELGTGLVNAIKRQLGLK